MKNYEHETAYFRKLNKIAKKNGVVLFGSGFAKAIPVCELKQAFELDCDIYNRSLDELTVFGAADLLNDCVLDLSPKKVLLQLGETDLEKGIHSIPEIISCYEELIAKINSYDKHCKIVVVSVCDNGGQVYPDEMNRQLEKMAEKMNCEFADISPAFSTDSPSVKAFSLLKRFIREGLSFCDTLTMLNI